MQANQVRYSQNVLRALIFQDEWILKKNYDKISYVDLPGNFPSQLMPVCTQMIQLKVPHTISAYNSYIYNKSPRNSYIEHLPIPHIATFFVQVLIVAIRDLLADLTLVYLAQILIKAWLAKWICT